MLGPNTAGSREGLVNVRTKHSRESGGPPNTAEGPWPVTAAPTNTHIFNSH